MPTPSAVSAAVMPGNLLSLTRKKPADLTKLTQAERVSEDFKVCKMHDGAQCWHPDSQQDARWLQRARHTRHSFSNPVCIS